MGTGQEYVTRIRGATVRRRGSLTRRGTTRPPSSTKGTYRDCPPIVCTYSLPKGQKGCFMSKGHIIMTCDNYYVCREFPKRTFTTGEVFSFRRQHTFLKHQQKRLILWWSHKVLHEVVFLVKLKLKWQLQRSNCLHKVKDSNSVLSL